jgi:hypothetical protein
MSSIRRQIREAQGARLGVLLNTTTGTVAHLVREFVSDRPWMPQKAPKTRATVMDNGQSRAGYRDSESTKSFSVETEIVLDLPQNWGADLNTWSDAIAAVIADFQNRLFNVPGMLRCDYVDDDPVNVVLPDGTSQQVWLLHFRNTYLEDVGEIGKT